MATFPPVYQVAVEGGIERSEPFPHTLAGLRAAMDAAVLMGERTGQPAECLLVEDGAEQVLQVYDPATRIWRVAGGGQ